MDILNARMLAMNRAIEGLSIRPDLCLIDGNRDHGSSVSITAPHMCLVGGDGKSASIAAASILAKVSRDRYVTGVLDREYPQYQFAKHKGYGTKLHYEMLDRYGPCPAHRRTFLKKWEAGAHEYHQGPGGRGEAAAAQYLRKRGCQLLASQWRCRYGELDLVARDRDGTICFVEVKLRSGSFAGLPREAVDRRKQERLRAAAACYLSQHDLDAPARFDVAEVYTDGVHRPLRLEYLENAF